MTPAIRKTIIQTILFLVYASGGFLTYGYRVSTYHFHHGSSVIAGCMWPFYWIGRGIEELGDASIDLFTESPNKESQ